MAQPELDVSSKKIESVLTTDIRFFWRFGVTLGKKFRRISCSFLENNAGSGYTDFLRVYIEFSNSSF